MTASSGVGTLLDTRRARDYDADAAVDRYLNLPAVKARARSARCAAGAGAQGGLHGGSHPLYGYMAGGGHARLEPPEEHGTASQGM